MMETFFKSLYNFLVVSVLLNLLYSGVAFADVLKINNAEGLIDFSKVVNSGTTFENQTVLLDADIDFTEELSKQFQPIGKDANNDFLGTFDGQGHVINNLEITSSLQYVGLFGYSYGMTIKNTILDSSCSVTSTFTDGSYAIANVGGFVGYCYTTKCPCAIESTINMANVTFSGSVSYNIIIGGIAGGTEFISHKIITRNCVNYGTIEDRGSYSYNHIGGISGSYGGEPSGYGVLENCANFGSILINS